MNTSNSNPGRSVRNTPQQPQNQRNRRQRRRRGRPRNAARNVPKEIVHPCTRHYLQVLTDPFTFFNTEAEVCIPDNKAAPSWKYQSRVRGTFQVGPKSFGFVGVAPFSGVSNEQKFLSHSLENFTSTRPTVVDPAIPPSPPEIVLSPDQGMPYGDSDLRQWRLVGCGLRARYIGTELNRGGQVLLCKGYGDDDDLNDVPVEDLLSRPSTITYPTDRRWHSVAFYPLEDNQTEWSDQNFALGSLKIVIAVSGGNQGNSYEYEAVRYFEFKSLKALRVPLTTKSHADVQGISAIREFLATDAAKEAGTALYQRGLNAVYQYLAPTVMSYGTQLLTGAPQPLRLGF